MGRQFLLHFFRMLSRTQAAFIYSSLSRAVLLPIINGTRCVPCHVLQEKSVMSNTTGRALLIGFLGGLSQAIGTVVLARSVLPAGPTELKGANRPDQPQADFQERADQVAAELGSCDEEGEDFDGRASSTAASETAAAAPFAKAVLPTAAVAASATGLLATAAASATELSPTAAASTTELLATAAASATEPSATTRARSTGSSDRGV